MSKLSKKEVVDLLAEELKTTKTEAKRVLDAVVETYKKAITELQADVAFGDIGIFKTSVVAEREYSNPQTGGKVTKPAHLTLKFRPSATIKRELEQYEIVEE